MLKFIDINFHKSSITIREAVSAFHASYGYLEYLSKQVGAEVIFHGNKEEHNIISGVKYSMFRGSNSFFHFPLKTLLYIRRQKPDVVLVQGLLFPLQILLLALLLTGKSCSIIVQHHGGNPMPNPIKRFFQTVADRCVQKYMFTSLGNADLWLKQGVIRSADKIIEVLEGSTSFQPLNKETSKRQLKITADNIFLWVGRLDNNKDPLCVLQGFSRYLDSGGNGELYMIYQTEDLLSEVKHFVEHDKFNNHIHLIGTVEHENLPLWLSASDYFILGSHYEGSGYALIEAMACGCIPVVTDIPPFRKITGDGKHGILFQPGNSNHLVEKLNSLHTINKEIFSKQITQYFQVNLSFKKIADDMYELCKRLTKH